MTQWYELRVAGSPGTTTGDAGIKEGIAIGEYGRLCSLSSGKALKFTSDADAANYLNDSTNPGIYKLEVVLCRDAAAIPATSPAHPPQ